MRDYHGKGVGRLSLLVVCGLMGVYSHENYHPLPVLAMIQYLAPTLFLWSWMHLMHAFVFVDSFKVITKVGNILLLSSSCGCALEVLTEFLYFYVPGLKCFSANRMKSFYFCEVFYHRHLARVVVSLAEPYEAFIYQILETECGRAAVGE